MRLKLLGGFVSFGFQSRHALTKHWVILKPQNPLIDQVSVVEKRLWRDFKALKLLNVPSEMVMSTQGEIGGIKIFHHLVLQ